MRILGLLGGVASGKSLVARQLAELGAGVLDADGAGHEVLRFPEVEANARSRWGSDIFGPDGRIDRKRLAEIVFDPSPRGVCQRKYLECMTHPRIAELLKKQAADMEAEGKKAAVLDAPLLLEAGWDRMCDHLIFVDVPRDVRRARAIDRGWSEDQFDAREAAQESLDRKRQRADVIIDNSGPPQQTRAELERFWERLA
jgi:dephospho-CoA kinase